MSSKTTGEMYDEIVLKGTGQYMGSLRNPVSKLRSGPQGRRYNAIRWKAVRSAESLSLMRICRRCSNSAASLSRTTAR